MQGEWKASIFQTGQTQGKTPSEGLEIDWANGTWLGVLMIFHKILLLLQGQCISKTVSWGPSLGSLFSERLPTCPRKTTLKS